MIFDKAKTAGALLFVGGVQFIIFLIVSEAVYPGYSVHTNVISDLGVWGKPSAPFFDTSTIIFGLTVLASSYFINKEFKSRIITVLFVLAGAGALGVGIFPENTFIVNGVPIVHTASAGIAFVFGGIAAIACFKITRAPFKYISTALGVAALLAVVLFETTKNGYLGLGHGGMERMIAYPTILFLIAFGGYLLALHNEK